MGRWKERKGVALRAALLLIALLQLIPAALAEGPLLPPADLLLELRELTAGDFAYSVSYLVTNIGGSISRPCSLSVWDEHDMLTGNGTLVLERSLQELQPGRSLTVDLEWHLTTPSVHRLWAFADPENDVVEITKTNNIVFSTVSLPPPSELGLTIDGIPDDNRSGAYLAGVPLELGLVASTERGIDLAMYRFELYMDNGTSPLRSWSGGQGAPSLDVGKFPPGTHRMTLDSSFAGVRLGTSALDMIVVPIPVWTGSLSDLEMSFDRELEAYALSGTMDVPKLELLPEGENLSASSPIEVFEQEREVRIKAWVLPDMTTTFEIGLLAGMPHALDGSPLKAGRTVFRDGCELPDEVLLSATSDVVIDLSEHLRPITLPTGKGPDLPLDPAFITASGSFQVDLRVFRSTSGLAALSARADLEIQGNYEGTVFPDTLSGPGGASAVSADMVWKARSELLPGDDWTLTSGPVLERKNVSSDLTSPVWEPMRTYATMSGSHRGPFTSVHITSWNGNQTALGMWQEGSSVLLRGGYGRMAEPCIAPLYGGDRIIVWTEVEGSGGPTSDDLSDRDLWWLTVDPEMFERGQAAPLFPGTHLDMQPSMASAPDGSVVLLSWIRDQDMDMTTTEDRQLMIASYDGATWSGPLKFRPGESTPSTASCLFTEGSVPAVTAVDTTGTAHLIPLGFRGGKLEFKGGSSLLLLPEGSRAIEVTSLLPANEAGSRSGILMTRSGAEGEGRCVLSVQTIINGTSVYPLVPEREDVIASSNALMENPCGDQLDSGYTAVMWREAGNGNGTLRMAGSPAGAGWDTWTPPLDLDPDLPMTPSFSFRAAEEGKFWTVMGNVLPKGHNSTEVPVRIALDEMTWACDLVSMKAAAAEGYAPGDLASLKVTVVNRGLVPDGTASIHLMRTVRSKDDGEFQDQHILSEMVQFTELNEKKELTFSVTVGDMQSGFRAMAGTPPGSIPWTRDEIYTSFSAYPDPVVTGLVVDEGVPGGNVTVKVSIINMGHSRFIEGPLVLMADGPTPPIAFGPGRLEPVGLRGMDGGSIISSFNMTLDPSKEVTYLFGLRPGNGTTTIWPEVRECGWLSEVPRSTRPIVLRRLPDSEVRIGLDGPLVRTGRPLTLDLMVTNDGTSGPFTDRPGDVGPLLADGLRYLEGSSSLSFELVSGSGAHLDLFSGPVVVRPPGGTVLSSYVIDAEDLPPGRYLLLARIGSGYDLMGQDGHGSRAGTEIYVLPDTVLKAGPPIELLLPSRAPGFSVPVSNPATRTSWGTMVVLSNGRPEDGVVLSENILIDIGPHDSPSAVLSLPLKEGSYLLSVSVMGFPADAISSIEGMVRTDTYMFEHHVLAGEDGPDNSGPDPADITTSAVVAGGAVFMVLSVGAIFRLQGKDEER